MPSFTTTQISATGLANLQTHITGLSTMTTPFPIPAVTTSSATSITTTSATLAGSLGSLNGLPSANVSFQRSTTSGSYTNETGAVSMSTTGAVQINLTGLTRNTKYYFRIT